MKIIKPFLLWIALGSILNSYTLQTNLGYTYTNECQIPGHMKILILSYGSLVKQKHNTNTGDVLYAGPFERTTIQVPTSFRFLAGYPPQGIEISSEQLTSFPKRRATITIDAYSSDFKPLWVAQSYFKTLTNARNNLAAREGSPFLGPDKGYELKHIFYIRKKSNWWPLQSTEITLSDHDNWVMLKPTRDHQWLSEQILKQIIEYAQEHNAQAVIWAALPANIQRNELEKLLEDPVFVKNTQQYIAKLPYGNKLSSFENEVITINNQIQEIE